MRNLTLTLLTTLTMAAAAFTGCGNDDSSSTGAAGLAPANALVYGEATLDPEGDKEQAIDDLLAKFPGGEDAQGKLGDLLEKALREDDAPLSYKDDVEPWLGDEVAFYVGQLDASGEPEEGALLVATEDGDRSMEAVEKAAEGKAEDASYEDVDYKRVDTGSEPGAAGVVDGWLVIGTESGFKRVVDLSGGGESLEDSGAYEDATEGLPDDALASFYVDMKGFVEAAKRQPGGQALGQLGMFEDAFEEPIVATVDADSGGVELTTAMSEKAVRSLAPFFGEGAASVGELPAGSWLAMGAPDVGATIESSIDSFAEAAGGRDALERQVRSATGLSLKELIGWMGDATIFVRGESVSTLDGAVIVETEDEAASKKALDAAERLARSSGDSVRVRPLAVEGEGFTLTDRVLPQPLHVFQRDGRVVIAFGDRAARDAFDPSGTLGDSEPFQQAARSLGEDYQLSAYVGIDEILKLVESTGAGEDEDYREVKPYIDPLGALVAGTKKEGDDLVSSLRLTVP